jgi:anion-transporting  ArsA/GET3 family ATPase
MKIRIFVGTGGVGKTSVAAASGLKAAIEGSRCLVLTIDPATRLKTALGIGTAGGAQKVPVEPFAAKGELWAAQLDVKERLDHMVRRHARADKLRIILQHPIYQAVGRLVGMQELMAIERIGEALAEGYDEVIVDTAPSRHALEFLDKPEYFVQLVGSPIVRLVGRTYHWWEKSSLARLGRFGFELYSQIEKLVGVELARDVLEFFSAFQGVAEAYAKESAATLERLHDSRTTSFTIVTSPFKASRDAGFFWEELQKRKFSVEGLVVNRVWPELAVSARPGATSEAEALVTWYRNVSAAHRQAWEHIAAEYSSKIRRLLPLRELPTDIDGLPALHQIAQALAAV